MKNKSINFVNKNKKDIQAERIRGIIFAITILFFIRILCLN